MHERPSRLCRRVADAGLVAVVAIVGLFGLVAPVLFTGADPQRISVAAVTLIALQAVALWWRRRSPLAVLGVAVAVLVIARAIGDPNVPAYLGVHAAGYSAGIYANRRDAFVAAGILALGGLLDGATVSLRGDELASAVAAEPFGLVAVVALIVGRYVAVRRAYVDTLVAYSHQLEKDREEQARQAVREERRRIARDLHDQVAHQLGVVSLHTSAARCWLERDPARTETALAAAEDAARAALQTVPAILHALRVDDGSAALDPRPTLDDLEDLARRVRSDAISVDVRVHGPRRGLPAPVELTAYRLIQEALTNVVKHAGRAHVVVAVRFDDERLDVEVVDDGYGATAASSNGARLGLVGMRERVDLLDGTFTAGPREGGGFVVRATLPLTSGGA